MPMKNLDHVEAFEYYQSFLEFICKWFQPQSYLEIGIASGATFRRLIPYCGHLTGVDPEMLDFADLKKDAKCHLHRLTSDEYFRLFPGYLFDLVFVDGHHEHIQLLRDVRNSLGCLQPGGLIVAHDTFPPSPEFVSPRLCGDAYKAIIDLRSDRSLEVYTFPVRYGLTLIGKVGSSFPWIPINDPSSK